MKFGFLSKIFEGALSIEKTYNECDRAIGQLKAYNEKRKQPDFRISDEDKANLDEVVNTALENATRIIDKEGGAELARRISGNAQESRKPLFGA